jgi:hypothetical protein
VQLQGFPHKQRRAIRGDCTCSSIIIIVCPASKCIAQQHAHTIDNPIREHARYRCAKEFFPHVLPNLTELGG